MNSKKRESRERQIKFFMIMILLTGIACISVGYSVFSINLQINAFTYLSSKTWQIKFDNLDTVSLTGNAKEISNPVMTSTVFNVNIALNDNDDKITYYFDIVNAGSYDAKLASVPIVSGIPLNLEDKIEVEFVHKDGTPFVEGESLDATKSINCKLSITYHKDDLGINMPDQEINMGIILMYVQK